MMAEWEDRIMEQLRQGYHCSQALLKLSLDMRGLENPLLLRAMGPLGGGMFSGCVCGTLTGAVCALGTYFLRAEGEAEPTAYQAAARELTDWFAQTYKSLDCRELVEPRRDRIMAVCPGIMAATFEKMLEILEEHGIDVYE